jgi:HlyD family secretion protein
MDAMKNKPFLPLKFWVIALCVLALIAAAFIFLQKNHVELVVRDKAFDAANTANAPNQKNNIDNTSDAKLPEATLTGNASKSDIKPALTVAAIKPESRSLTANFASNGTVAAWQEASVSAESSGLRLIEINAAVGDTVSKGQVLARFDSATLNAEIAASKAALAEAQAASDEAQTNASRAKDLAAQGFYSKQAISQTNVQEKSAAARLDAAKAHVALQQLRLDHTVLRAPDNGVITMRNAAVGSVVQAGMELFRLNRQGRLEWRAEVTSAELPLITRGSSVIIEGGKAQGTVRQIAPNLDAQTRNAIVYVDIAAGSSLKVGQFVRGQFAGAASKTALTVPSTAVVMRDGFSYVFVIKNAVTTAKNTTSKAVQTKVNLGQRQDNSIEIVDGISPQDSLVATGAAFLTDGDTVKVVQP